MGYNFHFDTEKEALYFVDRVIEIAECYGRVTLCDIYDINGSHGDYAHTKIGWTLDSINTRVYTKFDSALKHYIVTFPEPDFNVNKPNKNKSCITPTSCIVKKESETSPEPLSIDICMDVLEDPCAILHEVFDLAKEIKDRLVFITIS